MKLWIYYRISDKGHRDNKPNYIKIRKCLTHFLTIFSRKYIVLFADNCEVETVKWLKTLGIYKIIETNLGNARGCEFVWKHAIKNIKLDDWVYFVEDDYVHCVDAKIVLMDGINHKIGRYITLYDHPSHYSKPYGLYPTKLHLTRPLNIHWRETDSTTMTFACRVGDLADDFKIMKSYTTGTGIPNDYGMFLQLNRHHDKLVVASPIPGRSTHGQLACFGSSSSKTVNLEKMWGEIINQ